MSDRKRKTTKPKSKPKAKVKAKVKAKPATKAKPRPRAKSKARPKPRPKTRAKASARKAAVPVRRKVKSAGAGEPGKCPVMHAAAGARSNRDWWPNQLNLRILHQHSALSNPMGGGFNYA